MTGKTSSPDAFVTRETLAARLEEEILSGELAAGAKLPSERQLSERLGVSRPIVREALRMLAERNLVEIRPGRGSFVRDARPSDAAGVLDTLYRRRQATARDLVEARTMLESTAAALAAERSTAEDLRRIEAALGRFDLAASVVEQARYDLAFHMAVARAAHNPVIETIFASITNLTLDLMLRSLSDPSVTAVSLPYHRRIAGAIRSGDAGAARTLMAEHLAVAGRFYGEDYDDSIERVVRRHLPWLLKPEIAIGGAGEDGGADDRARDA